MASYARLTRFKNMHVGKRIVVVCNGPSLNTMGDLSFLNNEIVIGLNKIHLGLWRFGFYPRYLVAVNDKVISQDAAALSAMTCVKFVSDRSADLLPADPLTYHIRTHKLEERFYHDITEGVREGHTVTHAALQIARYMGAAEVVILGMDHRYQTTQTPNAEGFLRGPDPNHFDPSYFGDKYWDAPNLIENERSYTVSRAMFEAEGRHIVDATLGGACQIFEKRDWRDVFEL